MISRRRRTTKTVEAHTERKTKGLCARVGEEATQRHQHRLLTPEPSPRGEVPSPSREVELGSNNIANRCGSARRMTTNVARRCLLCLLIVAFLSSFAEAADCNSTASELALIPSDKLKAPLNVQLVHNSWMKLERENDCGCGVRCIWQGDYPKETRLDMVIIMTHMRTIPARAFPEQVLAFLELEPPIHGSYGADARTAKAHGYDWKITYERDSDLLLSYAPSKLNFDLYNTTKHFWRQDYVALLMVSNCKDGDRLEYAVELMKHLPILSLGKCLNNMPGGQTTESMFPNCAHINGDDRDSTKLCIMSHFKFNLAFENSRYDDYVTEKLFGALQTPSVPIYRGSATAKQLLPGLHSTIFADDFSSPKELADYIRMLDKNPSLYDEYFEWKRQLTAGHTSLLPVYKVLEDHSVERFQCNACRLLHSHLAHFDYAAAAAAKLNSSTNTTSPTRYLRNWG